MDVIVFKRMSSDISQQHSLPPVTATEYPMAHHGNMVEVIASMSDLVSVPRASILDIVFIVPMKEVESGMFHIAGSRSAFYTRFTFELQKRESKDDVISQHCSVDSLLCPVKVWSKIIRRLINYPDSNPDTPINSFLHSNSTPHKFTEQKLLKCLCFATSTLGLKTLQFSPKQIGLCSARSGAAMAMYLAGTPFFTIILLGHWSSDAFL